MNQTYQNIEFLIVDDCSSDKSLNIILEKYAERDKRIKLLVNENNIGLTKSLNKLLSFMLKDNILLDKMQMM